MIVMLIPTHDTNVLPRWPGRGGPSPRITFAVALNLNVISHIAPTIALRVIGCHRDVDIHRKRRKIKSKKQRFQGSLVCHLLLFSLLHLCGDVVKDPPGNQE